MAFHPKSDHLISEYIEYGSLGSDAGKQILVLFIATQMSSPTPINKENLEFIQIDDSTHPAYDAIKHLFPGSTVSLPGIAFFDSFLEPKDSIYVPLNETTTVGEVLHYVEKYFL